MNIGNMEAVKEKFIEMYLNTWIIHTSVKLTNYILDGGSTPSVVSAIMKQQTTERARLILNHGMDIYSGSGICIGENNFFTQFYNSSPVGITVEGSNTLTRGLIIFGQGLNKSHPYIFPIFTSIQENDLKSFKINFDKLLFDIIKNYILVINPIYSIKLKLLNKNDEIERLERATLKFSLLTNFIALMGGKIKSKQMISGNMADILSNIYLGYSLVWYHQHFIDKNNDKTYLFLRNQCIDLLMNELEYKMNLVIENYPIQILKPFLYPLKNDVKYQVLENKNKLYEMILKDKTLNEVFKKDIYYKGTVLEKMENLLKMDKNSVEYELLYQDIIKVGEFPID
jgi:acyl-CoA dehydrogenase